LKLSILIPANNEENSVGEVVQTLFNVLTQESISHEILVINDHSTDQTLEVLKELEANISTLRWVNNSSLQGFGYAIQQGINYFKGDCVAIFMGDGSDSADDLVSFYRILVQKNYDAVFGSRFIPGGKTIDYPLLKLILNRLANNMIRLLFGLKYNDVTNAFKLYRAETIKGLKPFLSSHFNLTVELPLKVIARGYSYTWLPNQWTNRKKGESKLRIKEMGSRYIFIILYCFLEKYLTRGDYLKDKNQPIRQGKTIRRREKLAPNLIA
jgi:dolichol-phosphate mannosyltransferase